VSESGGTASAASDRLTDRAGYGQDRYGLDGRVAIVTGATRGLGLAMAKGLHAAGACVVITGRSKESCAAALSQFEDDPARAVAVAAHVADPEASRAVVREAADRFGRIDAVVNNAGVSLGMPIEDITATAFQKSLDVNLIGPLILVQEALGFLKASGQGAIVNVSTVGAFRPARGMGVYTAAKSALISLSQTMAIEFAEHNIRVNVLAPGPFATDMTGKMPVDVRTAIGSSVPLGRFGQPSELVGAALYLVSPLASFVTGQTLVVDGGYSLRE
jgi:NAD(P)-dependent dehydrogenase (short-subunit alcohol dehydrogenase family)